MRRSCGNFVKRILTCIFLRPYGLSSSVPLSDALHINSKAIAFSETPNCVIFNSPKNISLRDTHSPQKPQKINALTRFAHLVVFRVYYKLNPPLVPQSYAYIRCAHPPRHDNRSGSQFTSVYLNVFRQFSFVIRS